MKLDRIEIQGAIEKVEREFLQKQGELGGATSQRDEIHKKINLLESQISDLRNQWKVLQQQIIICDGIPQEIADLREEIMRIRKTVLRKDILIKTKENLEKELVSLYVKIQKGCAHPFVMQIRAPYQGSSTYDYENQHPGCCVCVACGYQEESISSNEDTYPTFSKENAPRIIAWYASTGWQKGADIWHPLKEILEKHFLIKPTVSQHILIGLSNSADGQKHQGDT